MYLTWESVAKQLTALKTPIEQLIALTLADIERYPKMNENGEHLAQLLANLNYYVMQLGECQPKYKRLDIWCEKRYEIEKGLETVRIHRDENKAVNYAQNAKYEKIQNFLDTMVEASAMHMRVQNARSSARDTTEAIRSRIGQLRGAQRSN